MSQVRSTVFIARLHDAFEAGDPQAAGKATEAENVQVVQALFAAIAGGDLAAVEGLLADDVEMEIVGPAGMPMVGEWRGRDEVLGALRRNFAQVSEQEPEVRTVTAQGDSVVVAGRDRGIFLPAGRPYSIEWVHLYTIRDGRLARFRQITDSASVLELMGAASA